MSKYEFRKDGRTYLHTDDAACLPDSQTIKSMAKAGYKLFVEGKPKRRVADDPEFHPIP
jgi:hypothetical protein